MQDFQKPLVEAWTDYVAGRLDAKALKGRSAGFGIYQQRDDKTMMRVRRVGGHITTDDFRNAANILRTHGGDYAHLTTRQDIQLHGVPAAQVTTALAACESVGFRFRGGGGDTFRNTLVSAYSGLHEDSVFDVVPYAKALSDAFYAFDLAYGLPRKLKIGFADRPADAYIAQSNDLGFLAKVVDGQRVFETYLGGGIGFKPRLGLKLFDALPVTDCIRVAMAVTALFNDKGCRTNRAHARIRFLREDLRCIALCIPTSIKNCTSWCCLKISRLRMRLNSIALDSFSSWIPTLRSHFPINRSRSSPFASAYSAYSAFSDSPNSTFTP